jgi:outer membrane lipoprotein carrier protein
MKVWSYLNFVIASVAKQSTPEPAPSAAHGLPRRCAPRNDEGGNLSRLKMCARKAITPSLTLALLGISSAACAAEGGLAALGKFLAQTQSGSSAFTQTVIAPKSAASGQPEAQGRYKVSTGQFAFARPNRFRFDYQKPYAQTIVADGQTLWFYDHDLEQVTTSPQAQALQNTPAALLTNARSVADLEKQFTLKNLPAVSALPVTAAAGLLWVEALPKTAGSTIISIKIGLASPQQGAGVTLKMLDVQDSLGQRSVMEFAGMKASAPASIFQFKPPAGVAVLQQ